ncbi:MAG: BCAM0308 family protein [Deltaproteobacteria bacterium]
MKGLRLGKKKAIDTEVDPYMSDVKPDEAAACVKCGAIYHKKRWTLPEDAAKAVLARASTRVSANVTCPGCLKVRDKFAEGFVTIQGSFQKAHKDEIIRLLRNKESLVRHTNPLARIIEIKRSGKTIEVTTTTENLAQRLGQMLHKTFAGECEYKWSSDVKLARVVWTRNEHASGGK